MEEMGKHTVTILAEMCDRVNVKYKDINFKKERWFMEYSWDKEEESDFIKWVTEYLNSNKEARYEIMKFPRNKRNIKKTAQFFVFNYGWATN